MSNHDTRTRAKQVILDRVENYPIGTLSKGAYIDNGKWAITPISVAGLRNDFTRRDALGVASIHDAHAFDDAITELRDEGFIGPTYNGYFTVPVH